MNDGEKQRRCYFQFIPAVQPPRHMKYDDCMSNSTRRQFLQAGCATAAAAGAAGAAKNPPNILFFFPDQLRFDWTGLNSSLPLRTPHLAKVAARGATFTRAVVASPLCAPSRACLASGKEYNRCGVASNGEDYPLEQTTYYTLLRESGYHVMGCGKFDLHKATQDWGLDGKRLIREWGFSDGIDNAGKLDAVNSGAVTPKDPFMAFLHSRGLAEAHVADYRSRKSQAATFPTPLPDDAYGDNWIARNGLRLLDEAPRNKPWHLVVNFNGPHNPWDITKSMEKMCRGRNFPRPNASTMFTTQEHVAIRQNYSAMVENVDRWLGVYLYEIERRGELDNTLVVFSSDHGEMLGDHNRWGKNIPYQASVGVPLVIAGPGVRPGVKTGALASVMDLAATFLDYAGLSRPSSMDSRSLRPVLEGRSRNHRSHLLSGLGPWRSAWDGRFKLVTGFNPAVRGRPAGSLSNDAVPPLLFDLEADPQENRNIASANPAMVARLSAILKG